MVSCLAIERKSSLPSADITKANTSGILTALNGFVSHILIFIEPLPLLFQIS